MANSKELVNQLKGNKLSAVAPGPMGLKALMSQDAIQKKFKEVLKDKAPGFTSSVLSLVNNDKALAEAEPMSILTGRNGGRYLGLTTRQKPWICLHHPV